MQELRSTEVLDREIQADARRKVEKILAKADEDAQNILASVGAKVEEALKEKEAFYAKKLDAIEKDLNASVPLEKQRFEVSFIQNAFMDRINAYLDGLSESKKIQMVTKNLDVKNIVENNFVVNAYVYGFSTSAAKKELLGLLGKNLAAVEKTEFGKISMEDDLGLKSKEGIILESEDKNYRCRLTVTQVLSQILDKYRGELSQALFG